MNERRNVSRRRRRRGSLRMKRFERGRNIAVGKEGVMERKRG